MYLDILNSIAFLILYQFITCHIFYHKGRVLCIPTPIERIIGASSSDISHDSNVKVRLLAILLAILA